MGEINSYFPLWKVGEGLLRKGRQDQKTRLNLQLQAHVWVDGFRTGQCGNEELAVIPRK